MKILTSTMGILALLLLLIPCPVEAQELGTKVYWMITSQVPLAVLVDYHELNQKEQVPLMEKHGYRFVAAWQTIVGDIQQVIMVAEFENMAAYHKARKNLLASAEYKRVSRKMYDLTGGGALSVKSCFMSATSYSRLK